AVAAKLQVPEPQLQVSVLGSAFYRNKAAYVVGKIVNGNDELPFAIAVVDDRRPLLAVARVLHGRHGRPVGVRRVPADDHADEASLRDLQLRWPPEAGQ